MYCASAFLRMYVKVARAATYYCVGPLQGSFSPWLCDHLHMPNCLTKKREQYLIKPEFDKRDGVASSTLSCVLRNYSKRPKASLYLSLISLMIGNLFDACQ